MANVTLGLGRRTRGTHGLKLAVGCTALVAAMLLTACTEPADEPIAISTPPTDPPMTDVGAYVEFCAIILEVRESDDSLSPYSDVLWARLLAAEEPDNVEALEAIHAWAQAMADKVGPANEKYEQAKTLIDDPMLIEGLDMAIRANEELTVPLAERAIAVQSIDEFYVLLDEFSEGAAANLGTDEAEAITALNDFSIAQCGFALREQ